MRPGINLSDTLEEDIWLLDSNGNEVASGELKYSPSMWPSLSFDIPTSRETGLINEGRYGLLKCKNRTQTFSLIDCEFDNSTILSSFVIHGNVSNAEFRSIDVVFRGVSQWFNKENRFKVDGRELLHKVKTEEFNILVDSPDGPFKLSSRYSFSTESNKGQKLLREFVVFTCTPLEGGLSAEKIKTLCHDLSNLFSILLGARVDIENVWVRDFEDNQHCAYFSTGGWGEYPFHYPRECFSDTRILRGQWEKLVNGYFRSSIRGAVWDRLAQMYRYEGFWDYKILGYVSLLEKYVCSQTKGFNVPRIGNDELIKDVAGFEGEYGDVLPDSVKKLFKNAIKKKASFGDRYHKVESETNEDIIKVINITRKNFKLIKRVRDCVAHGESPDIDDLNEVFIVSRKILLLLTYHAFSEWGLSDEAYLRCIKGGLNKTVRNADVDDQHLDRMLGDLFFVKVSNSDFKDINEKGGWDVVLICNKGTDAPQLHLKASKLFKEWHRDLSDGKAKARAIEQYVASKMEKSFSGSVSYLSCLYVESELGCVRVNGACIINPSKCFQPYLDPTRTIEVNV